MGISSCFEMGVRLEESYGAEGENAELLKGGASRKGQLSVPPDSVRGAGLPAGRIHRGCGGGGTFL